MGSKKSRFSENFLADSYSEASPEYQYGVIDPIEYVGGEVGPHLMFRMCATPNRSATPQHVMEAACRGSRLWLSLRGGIGDCHPMLSMGFLYRVLKVPDAFGYAGSLRGVVCGRACFSEDTFSSSPCTSSSQLLWSPSCCRDFT